MKETVRLAVEIPDEVRRAIRVYAMDFDATMGNLLIGILTGEPVKNEKGEEVTFTQKDFLTYYRRILERSKGKK